MPNFKGPVAGSNLDFTSPQEALVALQRNPQLSRQVGNGSFTAYALYAVVLGTGTAVVSDTTAAYTVSAPGMVFPFGAPLANSPNATSTSISSAAAVTAIYK
jgi:hypothetical protein